jgi:glutamate formiminotransferase/glutamate formiminotransferase/formiminotetrahydrofolate cyclodeaminase
MSTPTLLAIPNFSEGTDEKVIEALRETLAADSGARVLDVHSDSDHNRSVYTLVGSQEQLVQALVDGAAAAEGLIDLATHRGRHPRVGALDIAPMVYMEPEGRGPACAAALTLADRIGSELSLPVFLYGELTEFRVTRAQLRHGGPAELRRRIEARELRPDFGPAKLPLGSGAVLVAARAPLIAFNLELAPPADISRAREIASAIREGGSVGLAQVRAIGIELHAHGTVAQVSTNLDDYTVTPPAAVIAAIERFAPVAAVEFVGLPPRAALADLPSGLTVKIHNCLEDALATAA